MIKHFSIDNAQSETIEELINSTGFQSYLKSATSVLVQIYTANTSPKQLLKVTRQIKTTLPIATIIGATTVGEITAGKLETGKTVIGFTIFQSSQLHVVHQHINPTNEQQAGIELGQNIQKLNIDIKGVLLLSTPLSIDAAKFLKGMETTNPDYQLFGGGAGDYASMNNSLISFDNFIYEQGAIAVVLSGDNLQIDSRTYLGWRTLSRSMQVTSVEGLEVKTIDNKPAFEVYRKYLDIKADDNLFLNALEFPFLLERNGKLLARVPVDFSESHGLIFVADIEEGENLRLGYGDPELIIQGAEETYANIAAFNPEAIFLYSCGCRRFLMQEDVELETLPLEKIAPTFGFYTYGEFFADQGRLPLLNSTMVAVSMRESDKEKRPPAKAITNKDAEATDPYAHKHARIVSRLVQFITASTNELEQANLAKSQFLASTSHELRTPLTSISGYAEAILNGDISGDKAKDAVDIIHKQSSHLLSLINDLLDISKIEAQEINLAFSEFNLHELLDNLAASFQNQAEKQNLEFSLKKAPELPIWIKTDPERLNQILINLVGNALKFTEQGSISIQVHYNQANQSLSFAIADTGVGLTNEQAQAIFKPFHQIQQADGNSQGTGLGLPISQYLAKLFGGKISITSELGKGSCFTLTLPNVALVDSPERDVAKHAITDRLQGKILLAEDSIDNGQLFKLLLTKAGLNVTLVANGQLAVEHALSSEYDLIILDIQMPEMNGKDAIQLIRYSGFEGPILALTANAMTTDMQNYMQLGFSECLSKPISKQDLLTSIGRHLNNQVQIHVPEISASTINKLKEKAIINIQSYATELQNNNNKVNNVIHKIKGIAGQFEFTNIATLCGKCELVDDENQQKQLLQQIIVEISQLK